MILQNFKLKLIKLSKNPRLLEMFRFGCVGLLSTISDTLTTTFSYRLTKYLAFSVLLGYGASLLVGYFFHKKVTFKSHHSHHYSMVRYIIAAIIVYFINLFTVYIFMHYFRLNDVLIPKLLSIPLIALTSFLILKFWVFKKEKNG